MDISIEQNKLNTREQLIVLVGSTLVGFAASKFAEDGIRKFLLRNK